MFLGSVDTCLCYLRILAGHRDTKVRGLPSKIALDVIGHALSEEIQVLPFPFRSLLACSEPPPECKPLAGVRGSGIGVLR